MCWDVLAVQSCLWGIRLSVHVLACSSCASDGVKWPLHASPCSQHMRALQAISSRHGLFLGAKTVWLIRGCMLVLSPVAWPLAFILDKARAAMPRCAPQSRLRCGDAGKEPCIAQPGVSAPAGLTPLLLLLPMLCRSWGARWATSTPARS